MFSWRNKKRISIVFWFKRKSVPYPKLWSLAWRKCDSCRCPRVNNSGSFSRTSNGFCLFVLRHYGPVNPMGSCRARSVYLTTGLLGRLSPLSGKSVLCTFFHQKLTTTLLKSVEGRMTIRWVGEWVHGQFGQRTIWPGWFGLGQFGLGWFGHRKIMGRTIWPDEFDVNIIYHYYFLFYSNELFFLKWWWKKKPASVAHLDAGPTGDQEVAGSTPAEVGNILSWRLIMKYFLRSFSPFRWFKKGSCQFLAKECAQYWLTA